jgi:hypothetical protein
MNACIASRSRWTMSMSSSSAGLDRETAACREPTCGRESADRDQASTPTVA